MVMRRWHLSCCVGVIGAALATPSLVGATPVEDAYIAGYAAATLDQDLQLRGTPVSVHDAVVTVERADLDAAARRRAAAVLGKIRNVKQVTFAGVPAPPQAPTIAAAPSTLPPTAVQSGSPAAADARKAPVADERLVLLPGRKLFDPLIADPRTPHFGASFVHLNHAAELESGGAVSLGETVPLLETDAPFAGGSSASSPLCSRSSIPGANRKI